MYNEEIIKRLEDIVNNGLSIPASLQDLEALELAIKVLEKGGAV